MTKYREILRLTALGLSLRNIEKSLNVSRKTIIKVQKRAEKLSLRWPLDDNYTDAELERVMFPKNPSALTGTALRDCTGGSAVNDKKRFPVIWTGGSQVSGQAASPHRNIQHKKGRRITPTSQLLSGFICPYHWQFFRCFNLHICKSTECINCCLSCFTKPFSKQGCSCYIPVSFLDSISQSTIFLLYFISYRNIT